MSLIPELNRFLSEASGVLPEKLLKTIDDIYSFQKKWINDFLMRIISDQWKGTKTDLAKKFKHMNFDHFGAKKVRDENKIGIFNLESGYYESDFMKFNDEQFKESEVPYIRVRIIIDFENSFNNYNKDGIQVEQLFDRETKTSQLTIRYKSPVKISKNMSNVDIENLTLFLNNSLFKSRILLNRELTKSYELYNRDNDKIMDDYIDTSKQTNPRIESFINMIEKSQPQNINAMVSSLYTEIEFDKERKKSVKDTESFLFSQVLKTFNADKFLDGFKKSPEEIKQMIVNICKQIVGSGSNIDVYNDDSYTSSPKKPFKIKNTLKSSSYSTKSYKDVAESFLKRINEKPEKFNKSFFVKFGKIFNKIGLDMEKKLYKVLTHKNFALSDKKIKSQKLAKIIVTGIASKIRDMKVKALINYLGGNKKSPYIFFNLKKMGYLNEVNVYFMRKDIKFDRKQNKNDIIIKHDLKSFDFDKIESYYNNNTDMGKKFKKWVSDLNKNKASNKPNNFTISNDDTFTPNLSVGFEENLTNELQHKSLINSIAAQIHKIDLDRGLDYDYIMCKSCDPNPKTQWKITPPSDRYNRKKFNDYYKRWYKEFKKKLKDQGLTTTQYFKSAKDKYYHNNKEDIKDRKKEREEDYLGREATKDEFKN